MKRLILTLCLPLLPLAVFAQHADVELQLQLVEKAFELIKQQPPEAQLQTRGETFIRIASRGEAWENEDWVMIDSSSYSFDAELREIENHSFLYQNAQWENYRLASRSYENDLLTEIFTQTWIGGDWGNSSQAFYYYENELLSLYYLETWNGTGWENDLRIYYEYNADGLAELLTFELGNGSDWKPWFTSANTFNAQGLTIQTVNQVYNEQTGVYEDNNMQTFTYDADGNLTEQYLFIWIMDNWSQAFRYVYELGPDGIRLKRIRQNYDSILDEYNTVFQNLYEYDVDQNLVVFTSQNWIDEAWVNDGRELYFYELLLTDTEYPTIAAEALLFPNPASDYVELTLGIREIPAVDLQVYTADGRLFAQMNDLEYIPGQPIRLAVDSWPAGAYSIQVQTPKGTVSQLLIRR